MKLKDIQEGDVVDFPGKEPGIPVPELPKRKAGTDAPVGLVLDAIMHNVRATIEDMLGDPENYGLSEEQVANLSVERTLDVVGKILAGR